MIEPPAKSGAGLFGSHNSKPRFGGFVSAGVRARARIKDRSGIVALF